MQNSCEIRFTIHASRVLRTPLADFFSILLSLHQLSVGIVISGRLRFPPSCRKRNPSASV